MTIRSQDIPNQERRWLIELDETELALLYSAAQFVASNACGFDMLRLKIAAVLFQQAKTTEQITKIYAVIYGQQNIPVELYQFPMSVDLAKVGLEIDSNAQIRCKEILKKVHEMVK